MTDRPFKFSEHARHKMKLRRIDLDEVFETILTYQKTDKDIRGHKRYFRNDLCVVVAEGKHHDTVVTVLLNEVDQWTDEDVRNRKK